MKIKPLGERILVKTEEKVEKTKGGIYIPDTAKEKPQEGKIVAVGKLKESELKVGDTVIFESFAGNEIEVEGKKYLIMNVKDVLAKVE